MLQDILLTFLFIVGCFSLIISIGQFFVRARRIENYNLVAVFFCCTAMIFQFILVFNETIFSYPELFIMHLSLISLLGPLLYFAYFFLCLPEVKLSKKQILLFVPMLIIFAADLEYMFSSHNTKISVLNYLYKCWPLPDGMAIKYIYLLPYVSNAVCFAIILIKLISSKSRSKNKKLHDISVAHLAVDIVLSFMYFWGYAACSIQFIKITTAGFCVSIVSAFMVNQRYPEYLQLVVINTVRNRYKRSRLSGIDAETVVKQIKHLMEEEKMFADEDLTLKRLAYELAITPHQLSQLLNEKLSLNFNTFINHHRVAEAKKMLIDEPERSIMSICRGVGFNSKSAFYQAFAQCTGRTPHKYRTDVLSGQKSNPTQVD